MYYSGSLRVILQHLPRRLQAENPKKTDRVFVCDRSSAERRCTLQVVHFERNNAEMVWIASRIRWAIVFGQFYLLTKYSCLNSMRKVRRLLFWCKVTNISIGQPSVNGAASRDEYLACGAALELTAFWWFNYRNICIKSIDHICRLACNAALSMNVVSDPIVLEMPADAADVSTKRRVSEERPGYGCHRMWIWQCMRSIHSRNSVRRRTSTIGKPMVRRISSLCVSWRLLIIYIDVP